MSNEQWTSFGAGLLAGAIVGGAVALLLAPKSGKETRAYITEKVNDAREMVGEKYGAVRSAATEKLDDMRNTVGEKIGDVRHNMGEKISGEDCRPVTGTRKS